MTKEEVNNELSDNQLLAIQYLVTGKNYTQVSDMLGITTKTLGRWLEDESFLAELNYYRYYLMQSHMDKVRALIGKSLDVIENSLESEDEKISLNAAKTILALKDLANYDQVKEEQRIVDITPDSVKASKNKQWEKDLFRQMVYSKVLPDT